MTYRVKVGEASEITLNPDNFCPEIVLPIKIHIQYEAQHDGKSWPDSYVAEMEYELRCDVLEEISNILKEHIAKIKPYAGHQFK